MDKQISSGLNKTAMIILNYNSASDTTKLADELFECRPSDAELIIVDNNSSDNSGARLSRYVSDKDNAYFVETGYNGGYAYGNNAGLKLALSHGCDYALIMNSDITVQTGLIEGLSDYLDHNLASAIATPVLKSAGRPDDYGRYIRLGHIHFSRAAKPKHEDESALNVDSIVGACFMVRLSAVEQVGLIPEAYFLNFEETEWCLQFSKKGYSVVCLPWLEVSHRTHGSISQVSGLQSYFMKRNLVVFNLRMGTVRQKVILILKIIPFSVAQSLKHHTLLPFRAYWDGITGRNKYRP